MFEPFEEDKQVGFGDFDFNLPDDLKEQLNNGWPAQFYEHVFSQIDESKFAEMYDSQYGRPNFPVKVLVSLEIMKHQFDLSDKELLERFHFDARYIKALGLNEVGQLTLGERTLYDFRERLLDYIKETGHDPLSEIFDDLVANFLEVADLDSDIQRMDSTMVKANIKHLSRIQLMRKILDNLVKELPEHKSNKIHKNILKVLDDDNFRNFLNNFDKEEIRDNLLGKLNSIKLLFKNDSEINDTKVYHQLCRVVEEQSIETENQLKAKDNNDVESDSLQNPHDEDATYRKKGSKAQKGYSVNISETSNPDNPAQMITDVSVDANIQSDVNFLKDRLADINCKTDLEKLVVDGAYYGPDSKKTAQVNETELIPTNLTGQEPEYSYAEFKLKDKEGIVSCPMGKKPVKDKYLKSSDTYAAWFKKSDCKNCSYRDKCPVTEQKKLMTVRFKKKRYELDCLRAKLSTDKYQLLRRLRAAVEGTFSALKRAQGLDQFKVCGKLKVRCTSMYKALGYNIKQLVKILNGGFRSCLST